MINHFKEIGWYDPFPPEEPVKIIKQVSKKTSKKIAQSPKKKKGKSKAKEKEKKPLPEIKPSEALEYLNDLGTEDQAKTINIMAFPSRIILFKIMRGCIGVRHYKGLWMYVDI